MTQETGKRHNGAAAAILAVRPPREATANVTVSRRNFAALLSQF